MKRKLFCEISPFTYRLSRTKEILKRKLLNLCSGKSFAAEFSTTSDLPFLIYQHKSLIRRRLGQIDMTLQENKAVNLALSAPKINGIIIAPRETFSLWQLVGNPTVKAGYREGLTIKHDRAGQDVGGGLCQLSNLIHWIILHTPLTIVEHHHHDGIDLFPDFNRQIPFGTGTSILYNYLDYRFRNDTPQRYQLKIWVTAEHLCGELRCNQPRKLSYHIRSEGEYFSEESGIVYRNGKVYREIIDPKTGNLLEKQLLRTNHARVCYDTTHLTIKRGHPQG